MGSVEHPRIREEYRHPLISERCVDEPRPLKVIYIGAGVSGIDAAIQFPKYVPNVELVIYDKNADVGGTWFENRYPGCACDIPAHAYQLSFESWTGWSRFYAGQPEILQYWQRVSDKYDVRRYMKFHHKCLEARWNEETSKWHVKIQKLETGEIIEDIGDVFCTGIGALNEWKWPDIKGLHSYKGKLIHSAKYDTDFDASGKNIAVIGAGSSGIQIVPTLQRKVNHMDHYVRGRTWIAASFGNELVRERNDGEDGNFDYGKEEMETWKNDPAAYVKYRKALEAGMQGTYAVTHRGYPEHDGARAAFDEDMRKRLAKKPEIIDHMLPDFPPLCRRLTPGPGYLEALTADNVDVIAQRIAEIDETGIKTTDGRHRPVDAIVCATGFDTSFRGRFPIYGKSGLRLQDRYRDRVETYLSMCTDGFPNFFQSLGPNAALGNGNLLLVIEMIQHYIGQVLRKMSMENVKTTEIKTKSVKNFTDFCDAYFKRTVFSAECDSWYKSSPPGATAEQRKKARVSALWPGSSMSCAKALERPRWEDFEYTHVDDNEMGWLGDGWTVAERTADAQGLSYYIDDTKFTHLSLAEEGNVGTEQSSRNGLNGTRKAPDVEVENGPATVNGAHERAHQSQHGGDNDPYLKGDEVNGGIKVPQSIMSV